MINITGLPATALFIGFIVIGATPVWLAAKITDAEAPTFARSILALFTGALGMVISAAIFGPMAILIGPLCFLLSFKCILKTSFFGALALCILALCGYFAMAHFGSSAVTVDAHHTQSY